MPANAAFYLPVDDIDLTDVFPDAQRTEQPLAWETAYLVPFKGGSICFNVMPKAQVQSHLAQFVAFIASLDDTEEAKQTATRAITAARTVLGLETQLEFEENEELGDLLDRINDHYNGCVFMFDSLVLHGGEVLVGPLKDPAT